MKVTHIITGLNDGGAEAVLYRLCLNDTQNSHSVISLMDMGKYGPLLQTADIKVYCLGMPRGKVKLSGVLHLYQLIRSIRPDVVQTWMYHADLIGGLVAKFAGIRRVFWGIHHSTLEPKKSRWSTILIARICGALSWLIPSKIVCCAEKSTHIHAGLGYAPRKFIVIPNGYNVEEFRPDESARQRLRSEWAIDEDTPLIGMVARFDPQKDHQNLFLALSHLRQSGQPFKCLLVGSGVDGMNTILHKLVDHYGLQDTVVLLGRRNDIPALMNALDIHVLSSFGEAFPNVLAEAMACGTPCVSTDVGDAALIVGDTGWIVPPQDPEALAQAINTAIEARQDAKSWFNRKHAARQRIVENFSVTRMVRGYTEQWQSLN